MYIFGKKNTSYDIKSSIEEIGSLSEQKQIKFSNTSIDEILHVLDSLASKWCIGSSFYNEALLELEKELHFSKEMIEASLKLIPEILNRDSLITRLENELGSVSSLDQAYSLLNGAQVRYIPIGRLLHITAGNVFLGFLDSLVMGFITKNISIVKLSTNNQAFPKIFIESLLQVDKNGILIDKFSLLSWKGGDRIIEKKLTSQVDAVIAWGGETMINSYKEIIPYGVKLLDFGPKISFGVLTQDYIQERGLEGTCDSIAKDVCMWDQAACANMQNLFVEDCVDLNSLIDQLSIAFKSFPYSIGYIEDNERVEVLKEKSLADYEQMSSNIKYVMEKDYFIRFESKSSLRSSPLNRTLIIKKFNSLDSLVSMLKKFRPYLQTCGFGILKNQTEYIQKLSYAGVKRFSNLGSMLVGVNGAPHDGKFVLSELLNKVSIEFEKSIDSFTSDIVSKVPYYKNETEFKNLPLIDGNDLKERPISNSVDFLNITNTSNIIFSSGGTTGESKFSLYSNEEFNNISKLLGTTYKDLGLSFGDRVANLFVAGNMWSSFIAIYKALEVCEVTQFPIGGQSGPQEIINYIQQFNINVLFGIPSLLIDLAHFSKEHNLKIIIETIFYAGEKITPSQLKFFQDTWGVKNVYSAGYASVDVGPIAYQDNSCAKNEHILFKGLHLEVINSEAVISSTLRSQMPVVRYKTGDKVRLLPKVDDKVRFELIGRIDSMIFIWGARVSIDHFEKALRNLNYAGLFQIQITTKSDAIDFINLITEEKIHIEKVSGELVRVCEDIRNTVDVNYILNHIENLVVNNTMAFKNSRTGKLVSLIDKR